MDRTARKREKEKKMVSEMIALYCRKKHHTKGGLCSECTELKSYAESRSDHCPFMETKTFCSNCRVHCYKPQMREKIREVMRFSGPRMMLYHPVAAVSMSFRRRWRKGGWRNICTECKKSVHFMSRYGIIQLKLDKTNPYKSPCTVSVQKIKE